MDFDVWVGEDAPTLETYRRGELRVTGLGLFAYEPVSPSYQDDQICVSTVDMGILESLEGTILEGTTIPSGHFVARLFRMDDNACLFFSGASAELVWKGEPRLVRHQIATGSRYSSPDAP